MCKRYSFTVSYTYVLLLVFATFLALVISPAFAGGKKGGECMYCMPSLMYMLYDCGRAGVRRAPIAMK